MLETLGLIASEIGEAFAECTGPVPSDAFGQELADIALRLMDVAHGQNIDIDAEVRTCSPIWAVGRTVHCALGQLVVDLAKAINACRGDTLGPDFKPSLVPMLARVDVLGRLLPKPRWRLKSDGRWTSTIRGAMRAFVRIMSSFVAFLLSWWAPKMNLTPRARLSSGRIWPRLSST